MKKVRLVYTHEHTQRRIKQMSHNNESFGVKSLTVRFVTTIAMLLFLLLYSSSAAIQRIWSVQASQATIVRDEYTGAYSGLTIAIDDRVSQAVDKFKFVQDIQRLIQDSSQLLYEAMNGRAYIAEVNILIPYSWNKSAQEWMPKPGAPIIKERRAQRQQVDVIIGLDDPTFGNKMYTVQHDECGHGGLEIRVPASAIAGNTYASITTAAPITGGDLRQSQSLNLESEWTRRRRAARQFVRQWAMYRYGVFAENGFAHDPMYPDTYAPSGVGSAHSILTRCELDANETSLLVDDSLDNVSHEPHSSAGEFCGENFVSLLPSISTIFASSSQHSGHVGSTIASSNNAAIPKIASSAYHSLNSAGSGVTWRRHDARAPTKHNVLCHERSVMDVIKTHPDFASILGTGRHSSQFAQSSSFPASSSKNGAKVPEVSLKFIQAAPPRLIVALEYTQAFMGTTINGQPHSEREQLLEAAIKKMLTFDVGAGAEVAFVWFGARAHESRRRTFRTLESVVDTRINAYQPSGQAFPQVSLRTLNHSLSNSANILSSNDAPNSIGHHDDAPSFKRLVDDIMWLHTNKTAFDDSTCEILIFTSGAFSETDAQIEDIVRSIPMLNTMQWNLIVMPQLHNQPASESYRYSTHIPNQYYEVQQHILHKLRLVETLTKARVHFLRDHFDAEGHPLAAHTLAQLFELGGQVLTRAPNALWPHSSALAQAATFANTLTSSSLSAGPATLMHSSLNGTHLRFEFDVDSGTLANVMCGTPLDLIAGFVEPPANPYTVESLELRSPKGVIYNADISDDFLLNYRSQLKLNALRVPLVQASPCTMDSAKHRAQLVGTWTLTARGTDKLHSAGIVFYSTASSSSLHNSQHQRSASFKNSENLVPENGACWISTSTRKISPDSPVSSGSDWHSARANLPSHTTHPNQRARRQTLEDGDSHSDSDTSANVNSLQQQQAFNDDPLLTPSTNTGLPQDADLKVFARLDGPGHFGGASIANSVPLEARVEARDALTGDVVQNVAMLDDGLATPDLIRGDSIYSQYLSLTPVEQISSDDGRYVQVYVELKPSTVSFTAHDRSNSGQSNSSTNLCCGSFVPSSNIKRIAPQSNNDQQVRRLYCGTAYVSTNIRRPRQPARVNSLTVAQVEHTHVTVEWRESSTADASTMSEPSFSKESPQKKTFYDIRLFGTEQSVADAFSIPSPPMLAPNNRVGSNKQDQPAVQVTAGGAYIAMYVNEWHVDGTFPSAYTIGGTKRVTLRVPRTLLLNHIEIHGLQSGGITLRVAMRTVVDDTPSPISNIASVWISEANLEDGNLDENSNLHPKLAAYDGNHGDTNQRLIDDKRGTGIWPLNGATTDPMLVLTLVVGATLVFVLTGSFIFLLVCTIRRATSTSVSASIKTLHQKNLSGFGPGVASKQTSGGAGQGQSHLHVCTGSSRDSSACLNGAGAHTLTTSASASSDEEQNRNKCHDLTLAAASSSAASTHSSASTSASTTTNSSKAGLTGTVAYHQHQQYSNQLQQTQSQQSHRFLGTPLVGMTPHLSFQQHHQQQLPIQDELSPVQSWPADVLLSHYDKVRQAKLRKELPPVMRIEQLDAMARSSCAQSSTSGGSSSCLANMNNVTAYSQQQLPPPPTMYRQQAHQNQIESDFYSIDPNNEWRHQQHVLNQQHVHLIANQQQQSHYSVPGEPVMHDDGVFLSTGNHHHQHQQISTNTNHDDQIQFVAPQTNFISTHIDMDGIISDF